MGPVKALGENSLERAVREAGIDNPPVWFDEVGSTNDEALRLAAIGAPEWTVVGAGHQTAGRGRLGRSWSDVPGRALLCSVILRPALAVEDAAVTSLLAAVALLEASADPDVRSKWPNDVVRGDRKVAGILSEGRVVGGDLRSVVVGVGVNLRGSEEDLPPRMRSTAGSLDADPEDLLKRFLSSLRGRSDTTVREIVDGYRPLCVTLGRRVRVRTGSGSLAEGIAVDLDDRGRLVVEAGGRQRTIAFGEVIHLR